MREQTQAASLTLGQECQDRHAPNYCLGLQVMAAFLQLSLQNDELLCPLTFSSPMMWPLATEQYLTLHMSLHSTIPLRLGGCASSSLSPAMPFCRLTSIGTPTFALAQNYPLILTLQPCQYASGYCGGFMMQASQRKLWSSSTCSFLIAGSTGSSSMDSIGYCGTDMASTWHSSCCMH